jgi:flagellar hook-basal body complex protein FliE
MTSPISGIGGPLGVNPIRPAVSAVGSAGPAGGDFAAKLAEGLQYVQNLQSRSDDLAVKAATGTLTDAHDYMIASTEASLATQMTVAVRNKAVEAFQEIMRMQA